MRYSARKRKRRKRKLLISVLTLLILFLAAAHIYNDKESLFSHKNNVIKGILIVNKDYSLNENYVPDDLTEVTVKSSCNTDEEKRYQKK